MDESEFMNSSHLLGLVSEAQDIKLKQLTLTLAYHH